MEVWNEHIEGVVCFKLLSQHAPEETEETVKHCEECWSSAWDLNLGSPEYYLMTLIFNVGLAISK